MVINLLSKPYEFKAINIGLTFNNEEDRYRIPCEKCLVIYRQ